MAPVCVYATEPEKAFSEEEVAGIFGRVSKAIKKFEGSHNFHNYGKGLSCKDASAHRYIMDMQVERFEYEGVSFLR